MSPASGPSQHFTWREFSCHDKFNTTYPLDWRTDPTRAPALADALEAIRAEGCLEVARITGGAVTNCPLEAGEVFRTRAQQQSYIDYDEARKAQGLEPIYKAAKHSQHCEGRAADPRCPRLLTFAEFKDCVKRAAARPGSRIRYIEYRPRHNYIHVDVRPAQKLVEETIS